MLFRSPLPRVAGRRVLILRGNGGRELLADSLRERGATVDPVTCYQRSAPATAGPLPELWRRGQLDALTISSSEGLRNLCALLDEPARQSLQTTPVFVPHRRIAELARSLGLQQVIPTGPADAGIMAALGAFAWPRSPSRAARRCSFRCSRSLPPPTRRPCRRRSPVSTATHWPSSSARTPLLSVCPSCSPGARGRRPCGGWRSARAR